jgi:hypothetical protein
MTSIHQACIPSECENHCCNKDICGSSLDCSISIVIIILTIASVALFLLIMCIGRCSAVKRLTLPHRVTSVVPLDKIHKEILATDEVKTDLEKYQMNAVTRNDESMICAPSHEEIKRKGSREDDRLENRRTQSHSSSSKRNNGNVITTHTQLPEISTVIIPDIMNINMQSAKKNQDDVNDFGH